MEPACRSASLTVSPSTYLAVASVSPSSLTSTGVAWSFRKSGNLGAYTATTLWNSESTMKIRYFPGGTHRKVVRPEVALHVGQRGSANVLKEHDSRSVKYGSAGASRATISPRWLGNPRTFTETMDVFRLTTICRGPASLESNPNSSGTSSLEPMANVRIRPGKGNVKE